jgi:uncharacterized membrane protein
MSKRIVWLVGILARLLCGQILADEPINKLEVVSPKDDGIEATGINAKGEIVGFEWVENSKLPGIVDQAPILARGKTITRLPLLAGYTATFPAAISDDGYVVGRAGKPAPIGVAVPLRNQAFIWDAKGGMRGLGTLEGDNASFASDITPDGRYISGFSVGENRVRACVWERAVADWKATALPHSFKLGANVVPISDNGRFVAGVDGEKPCLWSRLPSGQWSQHIIGEPGSMLPRAVNNSGKVVGVRFTPDGLTHAVAWTRETGLRRLGKPIGYVKSEASAINNRGVVVGMVDGPNGSKIGPRAFVSHDRHVRIIDEAGPSFTSATAINDNGQVTGVFEKEEETEQPATKKAAKKTE